MGVGTAALLDFTGFGSSIRISTRGKSDPQHFSPLPAGRPRQFLMPWKF